MKTIPFDYCVRNLTRSGVRLMLGLGGCVLVVLLLLAAGAFVRGMEIALLGGSESDNVILLGAGSEESVERSEIDAGVAAEVSASISGIKSRAGVLYISPEVHVQLPLRASQNQAKPPLVLIRGVTQNAFLVHSRVRIIEGRFPNAGANELMVGSMLASRMGLHEIDVDVGKELWIDQKPWRICGRFSAAGTIMDGEAWALQGDLKEATRRSTDSCIVLSIDPSQIEFDDVAMFTKMRVDLELAAVREHDYYARLVQFFGPIRTMVWATAALIVMGGLLGGLNTMYAAFASRVRELATLQACGFRRFAIVSSLVQESVLLTAVGALVACVAALVLLDGVAVRFSMGVFGLRVDSPVLLLGMVVGLFLGLVGALPAAWRCLRLPIPEALKSF